MPRFGKKPPRYDHRTLSFSRYANLDLLLPTIPTTVDHQSKVPSWPMYGNDRYGDCVLASAAHQIEEWTIYAGNPRQPTDTQVTTLYLTLSPNDDGLVILDTLNRWRQTGLWDDRIDAFVQLRTGDVDQAKAAIYLFGAIKIGLSLPDMNTFGPWDSVTGSPNQNNGHDVPLVGFDSTGFWAVTWGGLLHMSWAWYQRYTDEAYALLSRDWLNVQGLSPDGFDYPALAQDLQAVTGVVPPPPPPVPVPTPPGCLTAVVAVALCCASVLYAVLS